MRKLSGEPWIPLTKDRRKKNGASPDEKLTIGVLTFEVSSHMSKSVHLWHSLSQDHITRLRDEILRLQGVRKLVSTDDTFLLGLALAETMDSVDSLARSVSRLGKRCSDPSLQRFDQVFADLISNDSDLCGFLYSGKKMERKVRKLEGFVAAGVSLYQELEVLVELEQGLRNMEMSRQGNGFLDFRQKVLWQRQAVKGLREVSVWNRSYDYTTLLLARSLFTIVERLRLVFGFQRKDSAVLSRSNSVNGRGALVRSTTGIKWLVSSRSFKGCLVGGGSSSPVLDGDVNIECDIFDRNLAPGIFKSRRKLLNAPPSTLGAAALALHYANVIIVIEKLAAWPHLIGDDARDDLYGMLPVSIRMALRIRLKSYAKNLSLSVYDPELAADWTDAMGKILEWLSPLAHNMIKWQSERNFEQHHLVSSTNVLLLQTLYYANQGKTEAAITELLVGLNYLWRYAKELNEKAIVECASSRNFDDCLDNKSMVCGVGKTK